MSTMKRCNTRPWTLRSARFNVALWTFATAIAVLNIAMNIWLPTTTWWLWLTVNCMTALFDGTMLRWSVIGYFWRKEQDALEREESLITEAFYALIIEEYKSRDRSN